ncbi:SLOG family protein [Spongiactinospora sp. TRM90649]|uniref:SLOG family protein n=1 Tax=Spongiactinospora sp. TRM90649 TaxID=3031114 RepID=UPI0023F7177B|nr:SLOG family protein [Spongiactinospora sp. TRM90649]MDF5755801.1 SLOG family protein [Spongiactinospora sp. TRM90649]
MTTTPTHRPAATRGRAPRASLDELAQPCARCAHPNAVHVAGPDRRRSGWPIYDPVWVNALGACADPGCGCPARTANPAADAPAPQAEPMALQPPPRPPAAPCGTCGAHPARLYIQGPRCAAHTPAAIAGEPEPGQRAYCSPMCRCTACTALRTAPPAVRILITGSRTWTDASTIRDALAALTTEHSPDRLIIVHGACPRGADALADRAAARLGLAVERHPADWQRHGRAAGIRRNAAMVTAGADVCLAFIRDASPGASDCARRAHRAGIPVRRWTA